MATATDSWLDSFTRRWKENAKEAERNQYFDTGYSAATAERCQQRAADMIREIIVRLAQESAAHHPALKEEIAAARLVITGR